MIHSASLRCPLLTLLAGLSLLGASSPINALEIRNISNTRAFSPNGDGVLDLAQIQLTIDGEGSAIDYLLVGLGADATPPDSPADLLRSLLEDLSGAETLVNVALSWDGLDDLAAPLADGFYYLHALAVAGTDSARIAPPVQIELNSAGPTLHSVAIQSSPFTPRIAGADSVVQFFFHSADFDSLTDFASAGVFLLDPEGAGETQIAQLARDRNFSIPVEPGILRHRLLWNGRGGDGTRVDGDYRVALRVGDSAGNQEDTAEYSLDMDTVSPSLTVAEFGQESGGVVFDFTPAALPDTLVVRALDRNGISQCMAGFGADTEFSTPGILHPDSSPDSILYLFLIPAEWTADSTYQVKLDAVDGVGNRRSLLSAAVTVRVTVDGTPPPAPVWESGGGTRIQRLVELAGTCDEFGVRVQLYEDGAPIIAVTVDINSSFKTFVVLSEGSHVWTAIAEDGAGNRSPASEGLTMIYRPGAAISLPGRLRGAANEAILVNVAEDAAAVVLRAYSLEGALLRVLEAEGGPREFSFDWDLRDADGRHLMDGLYVLNLCTTFAAGGMDCERKVVAVVRD